MRSPESVISAFMYLCEYSFVWLKIPNGMAWDCMFKKITPAELVAGGNRCWVYGYSVGFVPLLAIKFFIIRIDTQSVGNSRICQGK